MSRLGDDECSQYSIEPWQVALALNGINVYKASGPDSIPNWLLKELAPSLAEPVCAILINLLYNVHSHRRGNQLTSYRYPKLTLLSLLKAIFVLFHCYLRLLRCLSPSLDADFLTSIFPQLILTSLELFGEDLPLTP